MGVNEKIDEYIKQLASEDNVKLYKRQATEYKQRYYLDKIINEETKPKPHSSYPGFEFNLKAILWNLLFNGKLDPHGEWPYASQIKDSNERADIHAKAPDAELWFELGMYASDERAKYLGDFEKLKAIVGSSKANNIGILIHFEVYQKGNVSKIFAECIEKECLGIEVDYQPLITGNELVLCRLILSKRP